MENAPTEKKASTLLYWLVGSGCGCATLGMCVAGVVIIGALTLFTDSQPTKFVGSWKGRFNLNSGPNDIVYTLNKNGVFRQESFHLDGGKHHETEGRWGVRGNEMKISFNGGDIERATITWIDDNTFTYQITDQTDKMQIGLSTTFKRQ